MNKNFTLQSFKSAVSNASDYLKGKGLEVSHSTMLNVFSVFLGSKNWNTLQAELKEKNIKSDNDIYNLKAGIIVVISQNEKDYINYINDVIVPKVLSEQENKKVIRNLAEYKYYNSSENLLKISMRRKPNSIPYGNLSYNIQEDYYALLEEKKENIEVRSSGIKNHNDYSLNSNNYIMSEFENINYSILKNAMRRSPDIIICDNLLYASQTDLIPASLTGHLVIVGMKAKNETDALNKIWDSFSKDDNYRDGYINAKIVKDEVKKIIDLNML